MVGNPPNLPFRQFKKRPRRQFVTLPPRRSRPSRHPGIRRQIFPMHNKFRRRPPPRAIDHHHQILDPFPVAPVHMFHEPPESLPPDLPPPLADVMDHILGQ